MESNEIKEKLIHAIEHNETVDFFTGIPPYNLGQHQFEISILPTDTSSLLLNGVYELYKDSSNYEIDKLLKKILIVLLNRNDILNINIAASYILNQYRNESRGNSPFILEKEIILNLLRDKIVENKEMLEYYYNDNLKTYVDLLDNIKTISHILKRDHDIIIYDES